MRFAKNELSLGSSYDPVKATFVLDRGHPATKLTMMVLDNDIILQTTESQEGAFSNSTETEELIRRGFNSRTFDTPITAFRFKSVTGTAKLDFVASE